ncbi:MAG: hypothetical protein ACI8ZX_002176 [Planctomycetota bacterium]|jgi:hypothetical protein
MKDFKNKILLNSKNRRILSLIMVLLPLLFIGLIVTFILKDFSLNYILNLLPIFIFWIVFCFLILFPALLDWDVYLDNKLVLTRGKEIRKYQVLEDFRIIPIMFISQTINVYKLKINGDSFYSQLESMQKNRFLSESSKETTIRFENIIRSYLINKKSPLRKS